MTLTISVSSVIVKTVYASQIRKLETIAMAMMIVILGSSVTFMELTNVRNL